jgi:hypothetical protein
MVSKLYKISQVSWYIPVVQVTQEGEIGESRFKASLGKELARHPSQPINHT